MNLPPRKLLLIAFHFPPLQGSTGIVRTLAFSRYLPLYNWEVSVLTVRPQAYEASAAENASLVPESVTVERAWGLDARRNFSIRGKYPRLLALPDRWQSWIAGACLKGSGIIKSWRPDAIMSTYPIPSAHVIGYLLQRRYRLPWVAEFRDPMLQPRYPLTTLERKAFAVVERLVFANAAQVVVTTEGCKRMYQERFPGPKSPPINIVPNGYDPDMFAGIPMGRQQPRADDTFVLLHSGLLYPHERNPNAFFEGIKALAERGFFNELKVEFHFRATGHDEMYRRRLRDMGIASLIRILPRIPYRDALEEMAKADALMLFQADNCNDQIPAKLYEYLYCRKPILAFVDPAGDTGRLLRDLGLRNIAKLESIPEIEATVAAFLPKLKAGEAFVIPEDVARRFSRKELTGELERILDRAASTGRRR